MQGAWNFEVILIFTDEALCLQSGWFCSVTGKVADRGWYSGKPEGSTLKEDTGLLKIALYLQQTTGPTTEIQIVQSIL